VSATRLIREVALRDLKPPRTQNFRRQSLNQKFAFDFPIVWRSIVVLHEIRMLNGISHSVEDFAHFAIQRFKLTNHSSKDRKGIGFRASSKARRSCCKNCRYAQSLVE
jgi:hypothetical protein